MRNQQHVDVFLAVLLSMMYGVQIVFCNSASWSADGNAFMGPSKFAMAKSSCMAKSRLVSHGRLKFGACLRPSSRSERSDVRDTLLALLFIAALSREILVGTSLYRSFAARSWVF